jgi:MFS family permease
MLAAALTAAIVVSLNVGKLPPALPALRAEFGLDLVAVSLLVSFFQLAGMLLGLFGGMLADRPRRWPTSRSAGARSGGPSRSPRSPCAMPARARDAVARLNAPQGSAPVRTGRAGSVIHSLHEPA